MMTYRMRDLVTKKTHFMGNAKFGRTTQLIDRRDGTLLIEVMGEATKGQAHIAFLRDACSRNAKLCR